MKVDVRAETVTLDLTDSGDQVLVSLILQAAMFASGVTEAERKELAELRAILNAKRSEVGR